MPLYNKKFKLLPKTFKQKMREIKEKKEEYHNLDVIISYDEKSQKSSYKAKLYSGLPGEGIELVDQLIGCNIGGEHKELKDLLSKHQPRLISSGINKGLEGHHAEIHESFCEEIWAIASPYRVDPPFRYLK
ncbi:MAG: hypothetical protein QT01_C0001G0163 [archaeon GW2011_AR6]|nr:MAG: hypothetical protein QT01_C0001G0163 [archaeon GW2011_AR6]